MTTSYMYQAGYASVMEKLAVTQAWVRRAAKGGADKRMLQAQDALAVSAPRNRHLASQAHMERTGRPDLAALHAAAFDEIFSAQKAFKPFRATGK